MKLDELNIDNTDLTQVLKMDPKRINSIDNWFRSNGFDEITSGLTATSYIFSRPNDNYVIKFTYTPDPCYMRFVSYIEANSSNPHLPKITKMLRFKQNPNYILIGIEKLGEANISGIENKLLWTMQDAMDQTEFKNKGLETKRTTFSQELTKAMKYNDLYMDEIKPILKEHYKLFRTILDIKRQLVMGSCSYDLHPQNFMKRADGTIVIIDPLI